MDINFNLDMCISWNKFEKTLGKGGNGGNQQIFSFYMMISSFPKATLPFGLNLTFHQNALDLDFQKLILYRENTELGEKNEMNEKNSVNK